MAKIGGYPSISLAEARATFRQDYGPAISRGEALAGPRARRAADSRTVEALFQAYVDDLKAKNKSFVQPRNILLGPVAKPRGGKGLIRYAADVIGRSKPASEVTKDDILPFLSEIHGRGAIVQANTARACLNAAFNFGLTSPNTFYGAANGVDWGLAFNPVSSIKANPDAKRAGQRHLTSAEFRKVWWWMDERRKGPDGLGVKRESAAAVMLTMACGGRPGELLRLEKAGFDAAEELFEWSKTKNGKPHTLPLPKQAFTIMAALSPNRHGLYFPAPLIPTQPMDVQHAEAACNDFLAAHPGFAHFTPRDLRRTFKTLAGAAGLSKEIRDRLQNHSGKGDVSAKHYDRYDYLPEKRAAMKTWEAYLDRIIADDFDRPVTHIQSTGGRVSAAR